MTPTSSVELAETITVPETVEFAAGAVMATVGRIVSRAGVEALALADCAETLSAASNALTAYV
jgi:hypothetical protein